MVSVQGSFAILALLIVLSESLRFDIVNGGLKFKKNENICDGVADIGKITDFQGGSYEVDGKNLIIDNFFDEPKTYSSDLIDNGVDGRSFYNVPIAFYPDNNIIAIRSLWGWHYIFTINNQDKTWTAKQGAGLISTNGGEKFSTWGACASSYGNEIFLTGVNFDKKDEFYAQSAFIDMSQNGNVVSGWNRGSDLMQSEAKSACSIISYKNDPLLVIGGGKYGRASRLSYISLNAFKNGESAWKMVKLQVSRFNYPLFVISDENLYLAGGHDGSGNFKKSYEKLSFNDTEPYIYSSDYNFC